ncbi:ankyrin repeat-containing domain protein [Leptodontidium sp. 2 PMI_412]|nr:ankyrin repeat-containing domain protein [Leptodontidium sp. 2 PMI_412]
MVYDALLASHVVDRNLKLAKFVQTLPPPVFKVFLKNPIPWRLTARALFDEMSMSDEDTYNSLHSSSYFGRPSVAAALQRNNEILKMFLETESDLIAPVKRSALYAAIEHGQVSTLKLILYPQWGHDWILFWNNNQRGSADTLEQSLFSALEKNSSVAMFTRASQLLGDYYPSYAYQGGFLASAAGNSATSLTRYLLDLGAPASGEEDSPMIVTPLYSATNTGSIETVRLLLERGAKPNGPRGLCAFAPLRNALLCGDLEMVKHLVRYEADINRVRNVAGHTYPPINIALRLEHTAMFRFLLEQGADLRSRPVTRLVFHVTAEAGLESMARWLLGEGLVPTYRCVETAIASGHVELAELLRGHVREAVDTAFEETSEVAWLDFEGLY